MRKLNDDGRFFIKSSESLVLHAYPDPLTKGEPYTIGYGHTDRGKIKPGDRIMEQQADELFDKDIEKSERCVSDAVTVELTDEQFSALVSFSYNVGATAFLNSTLLKELNNGHYAEAGNQFIVWNKSKGKVSPGLTNRRQHEQNLFNQGVVKQRLSSSSLDELTLRSISIFSEMQGVKLDDLMALFRNEEDVKKKEIEHDKLWEQWNQSNADANRYHDIEKYHDKENKMLEEYRKLGNEIIELAQTSMNIKLKMLADFESCTELSSRRYQEEMQSDEYIALQNEMEKDFEDDDDEDDDVIV